MQLISRTVKNCYIQILLTLLTFLQSELVNAQIVDVVVENEYIPQVIQSLVQPEVHPIVKNQVEIRKDNRLDELQSFLGDTFLNMNDTTALQETFSKTLLKYEDDPEILNALVSVFKIVRAAHLGSSSRTVTQCPKITKEPKLGAGKIRPGYYWRVYSKTIPADAFLGGKDFNNSDIFIGQSYIKDQGVIPHMVTSAQESFDLTLQQVKMKQTYDKILCGEDTNIKWEKVTSDKVRSILADRHLSYVIGGHEDDWGYVGIGRVFDNASLIIGRVMVNHNETAKMYALPVGEINEIIYDSYELLVERNT